MTVKLITVMMSFFLLACTSTEVKQEPLTKITVTEEMVDELVCQDTPVLKVLTLNLAHGRKDGFNQTFISKQTIENNLVEIATFLKANHADIVALQEADGPSRWSGSFDHVEFIAEQADYLNYSHATHASSWLFSYGTALLSQWQITETIKHTFKPSPPTLNKGFTLATIAWKPDAASAAVDIDLLSVHLDFSRESVRENQISEIKEVLSERNKPVIILGDFNSDWLSEVSVIRKIANSNNLNSYKPEAVGYGTYKTKRFDWILTSKDFVFKKYQVLPDNLSDHAAVVAEICLSKS